MWIRLQFEIDLDCSHINAETPGTIHEGGELGYALGVSFGAVMDNPDLIVACVIGDGEAETGPTATYVDSPRRVLEGQMLTKCVDTEPGMGTSILTPKSLEPCFPSCI